VWDSGDTIWHFFQRIAEKNTLFVGTPRRFPTETATGDPGTGFAYSG
jgi:hypothetical protein